ncbi:MAG: helix-turn-helix transcriptional regulator [Veillonellales bacterium]
MHVHERVKKYIDDNHLKQISIAEAAGIANPIFNAMLNGKRTMYADDLQKICQVLKVSADIFINPYEDQKTA